MSERQIFIGGTGRSGTTVLAEVLGTHVQIHTYMRELRFITDPDGLATLCNALTCTFSPPQARAAVLRFSDLMLNHLTDPSRRPYLGFNFDRTFGPKYRQLVETFIDQVATPSQKSSDYHLSGGWIENVTAPAARIIERVVNSRHKPALVKRFFPKQRVFLSAKNTVRDGRYFAVRSDLCAIIGEFVDNLLTEGMRSTGKTSWCEQTPINAMHASFINELFPESHFILAQRDPRGVVDSFLRMRWAPNDPAMAIAYIRDLYGKWERERALLEARGAKLLIVRIEDLSSDPDAELARIASFLGLEGAFPGSGILDGSKLDSWRNRPNDRVRNMIERELAAEIEAQGYAD